MDIDAILSRVVQIGTVTAVSAAGRKARVKFKDTGITSDWLKVVQRFGEGIYIQPDGTGPHDHAPKSCVTYWMPRVNDQVLVIYLPVFNGDGFVVGGI